MKWVTREKPKTDRIACPILLALLASSVGRAETIFLDNRAGVVNGSTTYDPATRTCGNGSAKVYAGLGDACRALSAGDSLYIRSGTYSRTVGNCKRIHGNLVNYFEGALHITASGSPRKHTVVSAYQNEPAIIQAKPGVSNYNPDPADTTFKNSSHYYPNPAISVHGHHIDVAGLKTYGQVYINGHDISVGGCDLGGGGPNTNQGQVVMLGGQNTHDVTIRNNKIHHSCWGESTLNGAAVMGYNFSAIIENNEFYDNYGQDIRLKDCGGQHDRDIVIRYNVFRPTRISPKGNGGVGGIGQDGEVRRILIHNNLFLRKRVGIAWDAPAMKGTFAYNNTFVDCDEDVGTWLNPRINVHNNLHYHSRPGQKFYDFQTKPWSKLSADYNLFFSTPGDTQWRHLCRNRGSTLAAWQQYSGKDEHSVTKNPGLVNPAGNRPEDFKRRGKPQDVAKAPHGSVCGAYVTGREIIGLIPKRAAEKGARKGRHTWSFDRDVIGTVPKGWKAATATATWQVIEDKAAPSGKRVLALTRHKRESGSARDACWTDDIAFLDGEIEVRFKAVGGRMEKGGGLAWRVQDEKNYYSARTNYGPRGNSIGLYCMVNWDRVWKRYAQNVFLSTGTWYAMKVVHRGARIQVYLDGKKVLDVTHKNSPLSKPGGVGVCTKGDAVTSFDDLRVRPSEPKARAPQ